MDLAYTIHFLVNYGQQESGGNAISQPGPAGSTDGASKSSKTGHQAMSEQTPLTIRLSPADNVVVARAELLPGAPISGTKSPAWTASRPATRSPWFPSPRASRSANTTRSSASPPRTSQPGDHVHVHNCRDARLRARLRRSARTCASRPLCARKPSGATFQGFLRANGKVGTRNYIGVLLDGELLGHRRPPHRRARSRADVLAEYPNVDGVVAITHGTGCGMADRGEGYADLAARRCGASPGTRTSPAC